tara:strand:+ start:1653 stop:2678 length:1026 start_codon:yes stop_codon:yes gene_type:complete
MADNYANPLQEAETDISKATKTISGLLNPKEEEKPQEQTTEETQNSPEPTQEESSTEDQPEEQENTEAESQEEATEEVSQDEEQIETQEKQDSPNYTVKVNGQELEVTLDELRNGYSRDADYRQKTESLAFEKKQFQSESEKQRQDYSAKLNEANQMLSVAQQQLNSEINSADLEKLYEEDPTEAARIEHRLRKKQEKINLAMAKNQSEQKKQFDMFLKDQQVKLVSKMPEFKDPEKASQLKSSMKSTLNAYGFNDTEVAQVYDHRIVMLVNDAMKYRNMQKVKPNIAKKITKPGKVFTSGVKQTKADVSLKAKKDKLSRLKKTGSHKDAASIFLDMINNN